MKNLRNEIVPVRELKNKFITVKYFSLSTNSEQTTQIQKTVVRKRGFTSVKGLKITDLKNTRFIKSRVGLKFGGCLYNEPEYDTNAEWVFE